MAVLNISKHFVIWLLMPLILHIKFAASFSECVDSFALGMESKLIKDARLTSSSSLRTDASPQYARLKMNSSWQPRNDDVTPWLEVNLILIATVVGVSTQGHSSLPHWIKTYQISFLYNTSDFQYFKEHGTVKTFVGNTNQSSVVTNYFHPSIFARNLRFHPQTWKIHPRLRLELLGCYHDECLRALGMEDQVILDSQVFASSEEYKFEASNARLNSQVSNISQGSWRPSGRDSDSWLQVDFKTNVTIKLISTQGRPNHLEFVRNFSLTYSYDGLTFHEYLQNGLPKIFSANEDKSSIVANPLDPEIFARFIRIHPKQFHGRPALRTEFYGCYEACSNPQRLGVAERKVVFDSQLEASSFNHDTLSPRCARLSSPSDRIGWRAGGGDTDLWIQVDFIKSTKITGILSQGRKNANKWMKKYVVSYSNDGVNFQKVMQKGVPKEFTGNVQRDLVIENTLDSPIFARFVRLKATATGNFAAARLAFKGCQTATGSVWLR